MNVSQCGLDVHCTIWGSRNCVTVCFLFHSVIEICEKILRSKNGVVELKRSITDTDGFLC